MAKLIFFDLDGTLAEIGKGMLPETVDALKKLEENGHRIAVCSGKPMYYLCGMLRQIGLKAPILVGESGADIQFGIDLPPEVCFTLPVSETSKKSIRLLREKLEEALPALWYQPNKVALTPFFRSEEEKNRIGALLEEYAAQIGDVDVIRQPECYDVVPLGVHKGAGVGAVAAYLSLTAADVIAVGDSLNDYPMFAYAGLSIGIGLLDPAKADMNVGSITEALDYLLTV